MKKICSVFFAAFLAVMLCVPAFAAEPASDCPHMRTEDISVVLYDGTVHYFYCALCDALTPASVVGSDPGHTSDCVYSSTGLEFSMDYLPAVRCPNINNIFYGASPDPAKIVLLADSIGHCFGCVDCGAVAPFRLVDSVYGFIPHTESDCVVCNNLATVGVTFAGSVSSFGSSSDSSSVLFSSISPLVTNAIDWISAFVLCIVSNPLFLIFVCCIFVGLGIGLIKRIIRL